MTIGAGNSSVSVLDRGFYEFSVGMVHDQTDLRWAHHGSTGYIFVGTQPHIRLDMRERVGNWADIGVGSGSVTAPFFDLWYEHGRGAVAYSHLIVPHVTAAQMQSVAVQTAGINIVPSSDGCCHAAMDSEHKLLHAVFWKKIGGSVKAGKGWEVSSNTSAVVLVREYSNRTIAVTVSTPGASTIVRLSIDRKDLEGTHCESTATGTAVTFQTPSGNALGSSSTHLCHHNVVVVI